MTNRHLAFVFPILVAACGNPSSTQSQSGQSAPPAASAAASNGHAVQTVAPVTTTAQSTALTAPKIVPAKAQAQKLAVKRIVLAHAIDKKEPVDPSSSFNAKESKIYAFVEVENPEQLPGEVSVSFEPPKGKATADVKLAVGEGAHWRTWAFTRQAHEEGEWTAVVKDARGHELGRQTFNVTL